MPKLLPLFLVGGLPRSGKSAFTSRLMREIPKARLFREENYVRGANPFNTNYDPERHNEPPQNREYALNYHENAEFLLREAMLKDVRQAAYERRPVIAESNFFCLPKYRTMFRDACLTRDHIPIYVSIYIGDRREMNKPLDKYLEADNTMFIKGNRRPKLGEGFVSMSAREVLQQVRC